MKSKKISIDSFQTAIQDSKVIGILNNFDIILIVKDPKIGDKNLKNYLKGLLKDCNYLNEVEFVPGDEHPSYKNKLKKEGKTVYSIYYTNSNKNSLYKDLVDYLERYNIYKMKIF